MPAPKSAPPNSAYAISPTNMTPSSSSGRVIIAGSHRTPTRSRSPLASGGASPPPSYGAGTSCVTASRRSTYTVTTVSTA